MSDRYGNFDIYVIDPATGEENQVTVDPADEIMPAWSPDGTRIAFATNRSGNFDLFILNLESGEQLQLTEGPGQDRAPDWSPDGEKIAFHSDRDGDWEIYSIAVDSQEIQQLTDTPGTDGFPAWSPDGTQIAYSSAGKYDRDIRIQDLTSGAVTTYTLPGGDDRAPDWLPDGSGIAFMSDYFGNWEILGILLEDGSFFRVTDSPAQEGFVSVAAPVKESPGVDSQQLAQAFIDNYNLAFREADLASLFDMLHPAVINLYGAEQCQAYLGSIIGTPTELELQEVSDHGVWNWEIDGLETQIENTYDIWVLFSSRDQESEQIIHLAEIDPQHLGWFTDCGDPQQ